MFLLPQHPISHFGMIPLSGNTVDDVMMTVPCSNCDESVPIPSSLVKKHMSMVESQKPQLDVDNYFYRTRKIMLDDKLELQRIDLEFMFKALEEVGNSDKYEDALEQYMKGKSRYLSLMQEAVYMQKLTSEMVEDSTVDCSSTVRKHIKACDRNEKDLEDVRQTLNYLRKENENFRRVQIAATNLSKKLARQLSTADQYLVHQSSMKSRSSPTRRQHPKSKRSSMTEQSTTIQRSSNLSKCTFIRTPMRRERPSSAGRSTITSKSLVPNRLSRSNRSPNDIPSADVNRSQACEERVSSRLKDSLSAIARSARTRNLSFGYRKPNDNKESNADEPRPSSLVQGLPVDLDIEDSELLFES